MEDVKIIECSRDAMQGWPTMIETKAKVQYINQLLKVGFDMLDCTSFVSHRLIPQMSDSAEVAEKVDWREGDAGLLSIVLNARGAEDAVKHDKIHYLGFPYSVSPTFQQRNANATMEEAFEDVKYIDKLCRETGKELIVYLSMAFGNPYVDDYSHKIVAESAEKIIALGIHTLSLADTVGIATPQEVEALVREIVKHFPDNEIGVHLHSTSQNWRDKLSAAHDNGCFRFDGALKGFGGCPMAEDELVGNMDTGKMIRYFKQKKYLKHINDEELAKAEEMALKIFV